MRRLLTALLALCLALQGHAQVLTAAGVPVATGGAAVTATGAVTPLSDWTARSTASGVQRAYRFPSAASVNAYRFTGGVGYDPTPAGGSMGANVTWNSGCGIIGDGCLQINASTTANTTSVFWWPFDATLTGANLGQENPTALGFGSGQGYYIQFRVMFTNAGVNNTTGGGGRKFFSVSRTILTDTDQEIVSLDDNYRGVYMAYQGYGEILTGGSWMLDNPILASEPGADFNLQPGSLFGNYCSYQQVGSGNKANCWLLQDNIWYTYVVYVLPSHFQTADGHYTVWAALPGATSYTQIMDFPNIAMQYGENGSHTGTDNYNALVLWIYDTGSNGVTSPTAQYYDQLILSTQMPAIPAF